MQKDTSKSYFFGKKILIGISGSIAAYKIPELVRLLIKKGAHVKIILTKDAANFVTPLTLSTVSKNDVVSDFVNKEYSTWNNHVDLGLWADIFLIAPATSNTLAKMASGLCDNILLATYLSSKCVVFCAPAMDRDMYLHRSTAKNIQILKKRGVNIIDVESGELASGLYGLGRMCDVEKVIFKLSNYLNKALPLSGKKVLITAGPTYEKIDPVRFIGNFSSGKMGCELALQAANLGANVCLVIGPSYQKVNHPLIRRIDIENAKQMFNVCKEEFTSSDIAIFSAAVSDFKPIKYHSNKIKSRLKSVTLESNIDVLKNLSKRKKKQFIVGFALETNNEIQNSLKKLHDKNMDLIVLNSLNDDGAGFGHDTNKIKIIDSDESIKDYPLMSKRDVAISIFNEIIINQISLYDIKKIMK